MPLQFEDINTYDGKNSAYPLVNESVATWRKALEGVKGVKKAASICSGGEIAFFCVLPLVEQHLDLLDHSYESMSYAISKFHLIEKLGSVKAYKVFMEDNREVLQDAYYEANKGLPTKVPEPSKEERDYLRASEAYNKAYNEWNDRMLKELGVKDTWNMTTYQDKYQRWHRENPPPTRPRLPEALRYGLTSNRRYRLPPCQRVYQDVGQKGITEFRANRHKLTFCHGDLNDLVARGPYDFVYLSNAQAYSGRDGNKYLIDKIVKPGGYVAYTGYSEQKPDRGYGGFNNDACYDFDTVFYQPRGMESSGYGLMWSYRVCRTPA